MNHANMLPGLMTNDVEFFASGENDVKAINQGRVLSFEEFPEWIIRRVEKEIKDTESKITCVKKFIYVNFGGLDTQPDLTEDGVFNYSEYFESKKTLMLTNGRHLTPTELEILRNIYKPNKIMASDLCMSTETVNSHIQNITKKTGLYGKLELAIYATFLGALNPVKLFI